MPINPRKTFTLRCSDKERAAWDAEAKEEDKKTGEWAREVLNEAVKQQTKKRVRK